MMYELEKLVAQKRQEVESKANEAWKYPVKGKRNQFLQHVVKFFRNSRRETSEKFIKPSCC
ncbi:hypothetical protein LCL95_07230 [Bacillus timonensis]|nr:hypothetical protein [Bacillus timonensis]